MKKVRMEEKPEQVWITPTLSKCGTVEDMTQQVKLKKIGSLDDFGISGVTNP